MHTQKVDDEKLEEMLGNLRRHWEKPSGVNSVELLKDFIDGLNEAEKERLVYLLLRNNFFRENVRTSVAITPTSQEPIYLSKSHL